ncbi:MAG: hypothetical protein ACI39R_04025 [Lachnospiraceae bacterium]
MRSSNETYVKVAEACSAYEPDSTANKTTNSASAHARSCTTCRHFNHNGEYCTIDLYDKIVKDHGFTR